MKSNLEVVAPSLSKNSIQLEDEYELHPLLRDEASMTPQEKKTLSMVRMRKANIDLLKECIDHIKETWVLSEDEKASKIEAIETEISDMYEAIYQSYHMLPDEVDMVQMKTKIDPQRIENYKIRLKEKNITAEENEMKDISKLETKTTPVVSKIAKKLSLDTKPTKSESTPQNDLASRLGLKVKK